jgi:hypothetical protein
MQQNIINNPKQNTISYWSTNSNILQKALKTYENLDRLYKHASSKFL